MPAPADVADDPVLRLGTEPRSGTLADSGMWLSSLWFSLPGHVSSKSNFRKARGSSWKAVSDYEDLVHQYARAARPASWPAPDRDVPLSKRPIISVVLAARTGLDAGNLSKSVLDACEAALFVTDAQVRCLTDFVVPARQDLGLVVLAAAFEPVSSPQQILAGQAQLLAQLLTVGDGPDA